MLGNLFRRFRSLTAFQPSPGDLCSIGKDEDSYGVVKVVAVADGVVHVRLYKERFGARPTRLVASSLTLGRIDEPGPTGIGHLPLSQATFESWVPEKFQSEPVTADELKGYHMWQENSGGVW